MEKLSVGECVSVGWSLFKSRPWLLIGISLVSAVAVSIVIAILQFIGNAAGGIVEIVFYILRAAIQYAWIISIIHFNLLAHDNISGVSLRDALAVRPFWKFVGASFLVTIVAGIGMIFLIIPGIILGLMFEFAGVLVIERKLGPIQAMKESYAITRGNLWRLFLLGLLLVVLNMVGALVFLVGLLVTGPISALALIHAYRVLDARRSPTLAAAAVPA